MTDVQKKAVKDLLHLIVDQEQAPVVRDMLAKVPAPYQSIALGIFEVAEPIAEKAEDGLIDKI